MTWKWNGREYHEDGSNRTVTDGDATELINELIDRAREEILVPLNELLTAEEITVNQWEVAVAAGIKDLYIGLGCLAAGGRDQMSFQQWGSLGGRLGRQYQYLADFAQAIATGSLSSGEISRRSGMYFNSARAGYWGVRDFRAREQGFVEERWIPIGDDRTCSPCSDAGEMSWQPIGTFRAPGSGMVTSTSACNGLSNCRCVKVYRGAA